MDKFKQLPKESKDVAIEILDELRHRIQSDKDVFNTVGRSTKGHFRSIMFLDELKSELID